MTWVLPDDPEHRGKLDLPAPALVRSWFRPASGAVVEPSAPDHVVLEHISRPWESRRAGFEAPSGAISPEDRVRPLRVGSAGGLRTPILEFARAAGCAWCMRRRAGEGDADDRGNAILATAPLDQIIVVELPFEKQRRIAVGAQSRSLGKSSTSISIRAWASFAAARAPHAAAQARAVMEALAGIPEPVAHRR